ncbi:acyltransferase family protein [Crenalkalicoccus roseus]|uniref:acyltransferase family protein n=1 Tax=Crenalkalicoccus roseus TaxID=1485588 RepID=UPI0013053307|nr:acyltransferase [Crenalkalicoccus roseus]
MLEGGRVAGGTGEAGAPREASLTRLRFVLISWVVLYHLDLALRVSAGLPWLAPVLGVGYLGVDGFFLLSGFALWVGYAARPPSGWQGVGAFLLRRVAKIWPLHLAALLGLLAVVLAAVQLGIPIREPERFSAEDFLLQLLLVNAWETTDRLAWNYPSWALSAEWAGYLAFPLLLWGMLRLPAPLVPALALGALGGLAWLGSLNPGVGLNYTVHLGLVRFGCEFLLGMALGRLATSGRLPAWTLAGAAAVPAGLALGQDALVVAGLAAAIAGLWLRGQRRRVAGAPRQDLVLRLGEASFGVYLCWVFVEAALVGLLRVAEPGLAARLGLMAGAFALNLLLGWLAWRLVEVPAHRWILGRRRPAPVPAAAG